MTFGAIVALAFGLAMDAAAVSAARGVATPTVRARHVALVAGCFGGAQALMPVLGWAVGVAVGGTVAAWAHWIAAGLLAVIGGKMLWEARGGDDADDAEPDDPWRLGVMLALAVATSVDALAVGFTLPMLGAPFALTVATIGLVTAAASAAALVLGRRLGAMLGGRLDAAGGLVLLGLAVKLLLERAAR